MPTPLKGLRPRAWPAPSCDPKLYCRLLPAWRSSYPSANNNRARALMRRAGCDKRRWPAPWSGYWLEGKPDLASAGDRTSKNDGPQTGLDPQARLFVRAVSASRYDNRQRLLFRLPVVLYGPSQPSDPLTLTIQNQSTMAFKFITITRVKF